MDYEIGVRLDKIELALNYIIEEIDKGKMKEHKKD